MGKVRLSSPEVVEGARDTYSQAFRAGDFLFINGQIGTTTSGTLVGPAIEDEVRQAFTNFQALVRAGGASMDDVVKLTIFITDIAYRPAVVAIRREFFRGDFPCSTLVAVSALAFEARFEVEGVAYFPEGNERVARG